MVGVASSKTQIKIMQIFRFNPYQLKPKKIRQPAWSENRNTEYGIRQTEKVLFNEKFIISAGIYRSLSTL